MCALCDVDFVVCRKESGVGLWPRDERDDRHKCERRVEPGEHEADPRDESRNHEGLPRVGPTLPDEPGAGHGSQYDQEEDRLWRVVGIGVEDRDDP